MSTLKIIPALDHLRPDQVLAYAKGATQEISELEARIAELEAQSYWVSVEDKEPSNTNSMYSVLTSNGPRWCYLNDYKSLGGHRNYWQTMTGDDLEMSGSLYVEFPLPAPPKQHGWLKDKNTHLNGDKS
jgi:hypothetical protein